MERGLDDWNVTWEEDGTSLLGFDYNLNFNSNMKPLVGLIILVAMT